MAAVVWASASGVRVKSTYPRELRTVCEAAFAFLVDDFGYRRQVSRLQSGGFQLGYCGPAIGVLVEWHPRDPLTVWLVRLADGAFPARSAPSDPDAHAHYFDLGDVEAVTGHPRRIDEHEPYSLEERTAQALAGSLRACGADLLGGNLALIPALEHRIRNRARRLAP